jgi:hypothetical protein
MGQVERLTSKSPYGEEDLGGPNSSSEECGEVNFVLLLPRIEL